MIISDQQMKENKELDIHLISLRIKQREAFISR